MKTEPELLILDQYHYYRQRNYGTSYITGNSMLEGTMADFTRLLNLK